MTTRRRAPKSIPSTQKPRPLTAAELLAIVGGQATEERRKTV